MIFERINANMFRKIRQLESLTKANFLPSSRTTTNFVGINRCLNSNVINNGNNNLLAKFPQTMNMQLIRPAGTATDSHVNTWILEKVISAALPVVIPAAFIMENQILDGIMSVLVVMHTHWGLEAIITDYARPIVVGTVLPKVLHATLYLLSAVVLAGLLSLIYEGPGVAKAIKNFWAIGKEPKQPTRATQ